MKDEIFAIVLALPTIAFCIMIYVLKKYLVKKLENTATRQDIREITYESKKGDNHATKEDIADITSKVESVKVEFSKEIEHLRGDLSFKNNVRSIIYNDKKEAIIKLYEAVNLWFEKINNHGINCIEYEAEQILRAEKEMEQQRVAVNVAGARVELYVVDEPFFKSLDPLLDQIASYEQDVVGLIDRVNRKFISDQIAIEAYKKFALESKAKHVLILKLIETFCTNCFMQMRKMD